MALIELDRRGRILQANAPAVEILRRGDGLYDRKGALRAWLPADDARLQEVLAGALPSRGGQAAAGSTIIRRLGGDRGLTLHVNPVEGDWFHFAAGRAAALVLLTEPGGRPPLNAEWVADVLGLTIAESQAAVMLCDGTTMADIAAAMGRRATTVNDLIKGACTKLGVSSQAELMRLVLSLDETAALPPLKQRLRHNANGAFSPRSPAPGVRPLHARSFPNPPSL